MITVKELQARRQLDLTQIMEEISQRVIDADNEGDRVLTLDVVKYRPRLIESIAMELKKAGYRVSSQRGGYQQGSTNSYHFLTICWE